MNIETVEVRPQPMIYVTRSASMAPQEIADVMGDAFDVIGAFIGRTGIAPAGPPIAVYRDWDDGKMKIDIGVPISAADTAKAEGEVAAGETPSGKALRTVHHGPYEKMQETYRGLMTHMEEAGIAVPPIAWEVYVNDPDKTASADLLTEIYLPTA